MTNKYKVGDEAELGPVRMNKFLGEVAAQGGRVEVYGNVAKVVYMPPAKGGKLDIPETLDEEEPKKVAPRRKAAPKTEDA